MFVDPIYLLAVLLTAVHAAPLNTTTFEAASVEPHMDPGSTSHLERRARIMQVTITGTFGGPKLARPYIYGSSSKLGSTPLPNAIMERMEEALAAKWGIHSFDSIFFQNEWKGTSRAAQDETFTCSYSGVGICTAKQPCIGKVGPDGVFIETKK
ncbi:uncharacterized protein C8R40DRAFT_314107 [Lentinula edodes]|uniref:uncharacterized protein n=1 Tax=Lentinula edodes TaxID=5353 RepID=UPI001E8E66D0|nr:uncharacterized protein C8R40DRAFT_314107 [Lentinula edodes]KAH7874408.1 hypothetical protein C8R40DRAFT_314107 [Lentinula edodes]